MPKSPEPLDVEQTLLALAKHNNGVLTPDLVLAEASSPRSPLHNSFTWDDGVAAHNWRIEEARRLIRSVRYEETIESTVIKTVRFVHHPQEDGGQNYTDIARVRTRSQRAREIVAREIAQAIGALKRANDIAAVLGLGDEINSMISQAQSVRDLIDEMKDE